MIPLIVIYSFAASWSAIFAYLMRRQRLAFVATCLADANKWQLLADGTAFADDAAMYAEFAARWRSLADSRRQPRFEEVYIRVVGIAAVGMAIWSAVSP